MLSHRVTVNSNQYGVLVSWSFNIGSGAAKSSILIQRLNNGEDVNKVLSEELPKWVYGNDRKFPGLERRRCAEIALTKNATSAIALPVQC